MKVQPASFLLKLIVLFLAYYGTASFGLSLDAVSGFATLVWPPTGIALAGVFIGGFRLWPAVLLAATLVNFDTGAPLLVALGIGIGNTLEALVGAYLLRQLGFQRNLERVRDILFLVAFAALGAPVVSASVGVTSLWLGGIVATTSYGATWLAWWIGDMLGVLIIAAFLFTWLRRRWNVTLKHIIEASVLGLLLVAFGLAVFGGFFMEQTVTSLSYLLFLPLIGIAIRFRQRAVTLAILALSIASIWGTTQGQGPFVRETLADSLLYLQVFMAVAAITTLTLAAAVAQKDQAMKEAQLRRRREGALLENIGDGLIAIGADGEIELINPAAERLLGRSSRDSIGRPHHEVMPVINEKGDPLPAAAHPYQRALNAAAPITGTFNCRRQDQSVFVAAVTASTLAGAGAPGGVVLVFRDVTREKAIDRAKTEFVSIASHQLRAPLGILRWNTETLLAEELGPLAPKIKERLKRNYDTTLRMIGLVNDLLDVSRIEAGRLYDKPRPTDVAALLKKVLAAMENEARERAITFKLNLPAKALPSVLIDPTRLAEVFENVLSNAHKYSRAGGAVTVALKQQAKQLVNTVSDAGIGIPPEEQPRVFSRFFRAENAMTAQSRGSGLGLFIVKSYVDSWGGSVQFKSAEGKGTTFTITIPLKPRQHVFRYQQPQLDAGK